MLTENVETGILITGGEINKESFARGKTNA